MANFGNSNGSNNGGGGGGGGGLSVSFPVEEIVEPRCSVCKSKFRRTMDQLLVMGVAFSEISRQFETEGITRRALSNHKRKHLSVEQAAIRKVIEEKARQIGEDVENTKSLLLTRRGYMEVAMMKSYQSILDGTVVPEPRDIVHMISLMEKMEKDTAAVQVDEMMRDFNAFTQAVKEVVGQEDYDKIIYKFKNILDQERVLTDNYLNNPQVIETLPTSQPLEIEAEEGEEE
jgi:replicative superfamily II helicase